MSKFLTEDFLLPTEIAKELYHSVAVHQPIIDYHCHLPPTQVSEDYRFKNLTDIWLRGDHYKWRGMRTNGVDERFCTGDASDKEKFMAWAKTVPQTIGNPLFHWTHLELRRPFGITDTILNESTAEGIWHQCNQMLATPEFCLQYHRLGSYRTWWQSLRYRVGLSNTKWFLVGHLQHREH